MSRPGPTPETRQRILDAVGQLVAAQGIKATSVEDILKTAGVSRRTFYQYFSGKPAALLALYESYIDQLVVWAKESIETEADPIAKVQGVIGAYMRFQRDGGPLLSVLQAEAFRPDSPLHPVRDRAFDGMVEVIDDGVFGVLGVRADPLIYRGMLMGIEGLIAHVRQQQGPDRIDRDRIAEVIRALVRPVLAATPEGPMRPEVG